METQTTAGMATAAATGNRGRWARSSEELRASGASGLASCSGSEQSGGSGGGVNCGVTGEREGEADAWRRVLMASDGVAGVGKDGGFTGYWCSGEDGGTLGARWKETPTPGKSAATGAAMGGGAATGTAMGGALLRASKGAGCGSLASGPASRVGAHCAGARGGGGDAVVRAWAAWVDA
ncbi:loricrin-like [Eucalyptus grandis]|uniref:loricrin-like n=1 Tax=Eucalyptus grandis TaxID=71139 RepID=UPI00192EB3B7|nr:loricrin-like [Eucalyptus grandis]